MVNREQSLCNELTVNSLPLLLVEFLADTEGAQRVVTPLHHSIGLVAEQYIDQVTRAKPLSAAKRTGQRLLRSYSTVPYFRRRETAVAVAASRRGFAEVTEQAHAPATGRFT